MVVLANLFCAGLSLSVTSVMTELAPVAVMIPRHQQPLGNFERKSFINP